MNKYLAFVILALMMTVVLVAAQENVTTNETTQTNQTPDVNITLDLNQTVDLNQTIDLNQTGNLTNTTGNYTGNYTQNNQTNQTSQNNQTGNYTNNQTSNITLNRISILGINPLKGKIFSKDDTKPTSVNVRFNGTLDPAKSNITLRHNGQVEPWIIYRVVGPQEFAFQLDQQPDGIYHGVWNLTSIDNQSLIYEYEFSILTTQPPKAFNIGPAKGIYTDEKATLEAQINGTNYTIQWQINDGYPTASSSKWKSLGQTGDKYSESINFANADVGALYLKVMDAAGNYRIQPTGIISAPSFSVDPETSRTTAYRDEDANFEFVVHKKLAELTNLRCKLENMIKEKGTSLQKILNINGNTFLTFGGTEVDISNNYDKTLVIGREKESTVTMAVSIPKDTESGEYKGNLQCVITK